MQKLFEKLAGSREDLEVHPDNIDLAYLLRNDGCSCLWVERWKFEVYSIPLEDRESKENECHNIQIPRILSGWWSTYYLVGSLF